MALAGFGRGAGSSCLCEESEPPLLLDKFPLCSEGFSPLRPQPPDSWRAPATAALSNSIAQIPDPGSSGVREGSGAPAWLSSGMGVLMSPPSSRLTPSCTPRLPPGFVLGLLGSHSCVFPSLANPHWLYLSSWSHRASGQVALCLPGEQGANLSGHQAPQGSSDLSPWEGWPWRGAL